MNTKIYFLALVVATIIMSCGNNSKSIDYPETDLAVNPLIPYPIQIEASGSGFGLSTNTEIVVDTESENLKFIADYLANSISDQTKIHPVVSNKPNKRARGVICIGLTKEIDPKKEEAYEISISNDSLVLSAATEAGLFRGVQTIRQLIPPMSNDTIYKEPLYVIPTGKIVDEPVMSYRGAMLDVARHFFTVDEVKRYIDQLAYFKFNKFHMHLSDDQGWRIEIKSWPKLTEVGAQSEVGGGEGGFYTQEQFKDLVDYAAQRYIEIIPEIDMPGHTNAACYSYPFLNGNGKDLEYYTGTQVGFSTFDARKDSTYLFLDDVIREISAISPSEYFHIGGDESHVTKKADYIYFVDKLEEMVQNHGKRMIGWNEIAQADLSPSSVGQLWNEPHNALKAAEAGCSIILSPATKCYLDMQYDSTSIYGLHWAAYIEVDDAYNWDPLTFVEGLPQDKILGIEAPLWSETISNSAELEYLAFPRAACIAELGWTPQDRRDWSEFSLRLAMQESYFERENIQYYPSSKIPWAK